MMEPKPTAAQITFYCELLQEIGIAIDSAQLPETNSSRTT